MLQEMSLSRSEEIKSIQKRIREYKQQLRSMQQTAATWLKEGEELAESIEDFDKERARQDVESSLLLEIMSCDLARLRELECGQRFRALKLAAATTGAALVIFCRFSRHLF